MSSEILRRAASRIRHDVEFGQAHGDETFLLAVLDWLEATATGLERRGVTARIRRDEQTALAAARTYLGEAS